MKPESLLESDPINICLARKTKLPFRVLDETPNGSYGLVINGYSLVGSTEPLCSSIPSPLPQDHPASGNKPSLFPSLGTVP